MSRSPMQSGELKKGWLKNPACNHIVQFYHGSTTLISSMSEFISEGVMRGEVCIVIATNEHILALNKAVSSIVDLGKAENSGQYIVFDARQVLSDISEDSVIVPALFMEVVGGLVAKAAETGKPIRAFGEMVALLWGAGNPREAINLEKYWNELGKLYNFSLFCAYPSYHFDGSDHHEEVKNNIINTHSLVAI